MKVTEILEHFFKCNNKTISLPLKTKNIFWYFVIIFIMFLLLINYYFLSMILFIVYVYISNVYNYTFWKNKKYFLLTSKIQFDRIIIYSYIFVLSLIYIKQDFHKFVFILSLSMFEFTIYYVISNYWLSLSTILKGTISSEKFLIDMRKSDWKFLCKSTYDIYYVIGIVVTVIIDIKINLYIYFYLISIIIMSFAIFNFIRLSLFLQRKYCKN